MIGVEMLVSIILATTAVIVGMITSAIWIRLGRRVSDHTIASTLLHYALVTFLLSSSEAVYVLRKSMDFTGDTLEYVQYSFIIAGFIAFMLTARLQLIVSQRHGRFSTPAFGRIKARNPEKEATAKQKPKGKKKK